MLIITQTTKDNIFLNGRSHLFDALIENIKQNAQEYFIFIPALSPSRLEREFLKNPIMFSKFLYFFVFLKRIMQVLFYIYVFFIA